MHPIKPFALLAGAILAGSGSMTTALATVGPRTNDLAMSLGLLLVIIGLMTLALNWNPTVIILRDVWGLISLPFKWLGYVKRSQWH